jgi:serralysin
MRLLGLLLALLEVSAVLAEPHCCTTLNFPPDSGGPAAGFYLAAPDKFLWKSGDTIRIRFLGGSPALQQKIKNVANQWTQHANLHFEFVNAEPADVRIAFQPGGSWSRLGIDCKNVPAPGATMNYGWFNDSTPDAEISRTTLHEFGHMMGMIHEHQSPGASIPWDKPKVYAYYAATQTPPWTTAMVDHNIFATYDALTTNFSGFDKESIMIYPIPNEHTIGDFEVKGNTTLSSTDKAYIAKIYPGGVNENHQVTLNNLTCIAKQEATGKDEIQVRIYADGVKVDLSHPQSTPFSGIPIKKMGPGDSFNLGKTVNFKHILRIEVWEIDNPNIGDEHDLYGSASIAQAGPGSEDIRDKSGLFEIREHHYRLDWQ